MKILKASAGSGKTYRLAHTYIDLLLGSGDPFEYRHILAVTFTNKATAEMKGRILEELALKARTDDRAREILINILHDYGAFSISTIDKFFQMAMKAFLHEIGQFSQYQIELERKALIREAMDRILDSLTEDSRELLDWLKANVAENLARGRRIDTEESLYEMGELLKSDGHRQLCEELGLDEAGHLDKESLEKAGKRSRRIMKDFEDKVRAAGKKVPPSEKIRLPGKRELSASPELSELFGEPYGEYLAARMVNRAVFSLGFAEEFYREFDALTKEKNVMCLEESNVILRDIIEGSDAPFVYEKIGVRYRHFLLDEFQDTSNIQWENFLPLLRESAASGGSSLVVGDVKQSIYRWRDSQWSLLAERVGGEFPDADTETMQDNWRSLRQIIAFNNDFFSYASSLLGLGTIYSDVRQQPRTGDPQEGLVRISFCTDQLVAVTDSIRRALEAGAAPGDIAVVVRNNKEGGIVAAKLIESGIDVISDDSLRLKSSLTVRRLVSLLSCIDNPGNAVSGFLAADLGVTLPDNYHSLEDLCEVLLRALRDADPGAAEGEAPYIQALMDDVQNWTGIYGNDLRGYLRHWDESTLFISSPQRGDAVRILTIHKAKGLEFDYVIFPFAEKVRLFKDTPKWCRSDEYGGIFPVNLSSDAALTSFGPEYEEERRKQLVDNINLFYVALTRPRKCLHVIANEPSKACKASVGKTPYYTCLSDILYHFVGGVSEREYGSMYDFTKKREEKKAGALDFPATFPSIALGGRLTLSDDARDFFGEDGVCGTGASARLSGIALHNILASVRKPSDLDDAVSEAVRNGVFSSSEGGDALQLLRSRIASHPEWFEGGGFNEAAIFGADGREYRPDRVVIRDGKVCVIDYKFGEEQGKYLRQVRQYMSLYRQLGYAEVTGALWFVREDKVINID